MANSQHAHTHTHLQQGTGSLWYSVHFLIFMLTAICREHLACFPDLAHHSTADMNGCLLVPSEHLEDLVKVQLAISPVNSMSREELKISG